MPKSAFHAELQNYPQRIIHDSMFTPQLSIDWGHRALKEENLSMTQLVLGYLLKDIRSNRRKRAAIEELSQGGCLAK